MPNFKMEQLYDMKKQSIKKLYFPKNIESNKSQRFLKVKTSLESLS